MILQLSHIFFTDALTFISNLPSHDAGRSIRKLLFARNDYFNTQLLALATCADVAQTGCAVTRR
jgi:hypothetical protein